jgi:hypothetical protein
MGTAVSVLLIATGSVALWALDERVLGLDPYVPGVVLLVVGALGLAASLVIELPGDRRLASHRRGPRKD